MHTTAEESIPLPARASISLILPALNEIDGLRATLPAIDRSLFNEILMIDGGSTDGSVEYARAQGIRVIPQSKPGLAAAMMEAIAAARSEYVIEFSPDGNCLPQDLPRLVAKIHEGYDVVVVSRYIPPAKSADDTLVTAFGNWMFSMAVTILVGWGRVTDALTIFRGFRRDITFSEQFQHYLYGPVLEPLITAWALVNNRSYIEIPGDEPKRIGGERKMAVIYNGSCILLMVIRIYIFKLKKLVLEKLALQRSA